MKLCYLFRSVGRKSKSAEDAFNAFRNNFQPEPESPHLQNTDFFKDYEEVVEPETVLSTRGMLTICPTPIGNLRDISIRQYQALRSADILACEDTRLTGLLLRLLGKLTFNEAENLEFPPAALPESPELDEYIYSLTNDFMSHTVQMIKKNKEEKGRGIMVSLNSYNQEQRTPKLIKAMKSGIRVVLVSDAGTPLVSDPGFSLVQGAIKNGVSVESLPGPVAAVTALTLSGFPTENFFFQGYISKVLSERINKLEKMKKSGCSCLVYESPHRIIKTVENICSVYGDMHQIFIAQEMTKLHERHYRGTAMEVLQQIKTEMSVKGRVYGEITIVIAPTLYKKKRNVVEMEIEHLVKTLDYYIKAEPQAILKLSQQLTGWSGRRIARFMNQSNEESKSDSNSE